MRAPSPSLSTIRVTFEALQSMVPAPVTTAPQAARPSLGRDSRGRFQSLQPPTDKQLFKFALQWCEGGNRAFINDLRLTPDKIERIERALAAVKRWEKMRTYAGTDRQRLHTIAKYLLTPSRTGYGYSPRDNTIDALYAAQQELTRLQGCCSCAQDTSPRGTVTPRTVYNEVKALRDNFECFWDRETKGIRILTNSVVLTDLHNPAQRYEFGQYWIHLDPKKTTELPKITAVAPRYPRGTREGSEIHPFVRNNQMCYGEGARNVVSKLAAGMLFDVVEVTMSVLNTYSGRHNPYRRIEDWRGVCDRMYDPTTNLPLPANVPPPQVVIAENCAACGVLVESATMITCAECGTERCNGCMDVCHRTGHRLCERCTTECPTCNNIFRPIFFREQDGECMFCDNTFEEHPFIGEGPPPASGISTLEEMAESLDEYDPDDEDDYDEDEDEVVSDEDDEDGWT